jgi:hypothetical protein
MPNNINSSMKPKFDQWLLKQKNRRSLYGFLFYLIYFKDYLMY